MSKVLAKKLLEKRAAAHEKGKAIIDAADAEGRALTAEESQSFDAITAEMDSLRSQADRLVAFEDEQRDIEASLGNIPGRGEDRNQDSAEVLLRKVLQAAGRPAVDDAGLGVARPGSRTLPRR